jgi:integral membrane protein (TIGR00529 family)
MDPFDLLDSIPAIVRILVVFVLILAAIKRNLGLGNAFMAGSAVMGLVFAMSPLTILVAAGGALIHPKTLGLSIIVSLILVLSHSLERSGQMARLLEGFKGLIRRPQINMVVFPALIGLLPMPGGAIFSAPMVRTLGDRHHLNAAQLSYINYWFRHIWEYWWPLYPGILLTTTLAGLDLWRLIFCTLPLTFVAFTTGYWPLRGVFNGGSTEDRRKPLWPFLKELGPIAFVIAFGLALGETITWIGPTATVSIAKELGLMVALISAIAWVWRRNRMPAEDCRAILVQPAVVKMIYMVAGILVFKGILDSSGAVERLSREMLASGIPLMPIAMLLPFLVGGVAGITIAFVGATFPILISLIHALGQPELMLPYMMLSLVCGFSGVLLSPLHLCLLLSNEFFHTPFMPVYRLMRVPMVALVAAGAVYFALLRYWIG